MVQEHRNAGVKVFTVTWLVFIALSALSASASTSALSAFELDDDDDRISTKRTQVLAALKNELVLTWGSNVGYETTNSNPEFMPLPEDIDSFDVFWRSFTHVSVGYEHAVLLAYNYVWTIGSNAYGQLASPDLGTQRNVTYPRRVMSVNSFVKAYAGFQHTIALHRNGSMFAWGRNLENQLGVNSTEPFLIYPTVTRFSELSNITKMCAGDFHNLVMTSNGRLYAWGLNNYGQLGDGTTDDSADLVEVNLAPLNGKKIKQISCGRYHNLLLTDDGLAFVWGKPINESDDNQTIPIAVDMSGELSGKSIARVAAGYTHNIVITSDGEVFAWGKNHKGQLGNGNEIDSRTPVLVTMSAFNGKKIIRALPGDRHSVALSEDGIIFTWGSNDAGQLGIGAPINSFTSFSIPQIIPQKTCKGDPPRESFECYQGTWIDSNSQVHEPLIIKEGHNVQWENLELFSSLTVYGTVFVKGNLIFHNSSTLEFFTEEMITVGGCVNFSGTLTVTGEEKGEMVWIVEYSCFSGEFDNVKMACSPNSTSDYTRGFLEVAFSRICTESVDYTEGYLLTAAIAVGAIVLLIIFTLIGYKTGICKESEMTHHRNGALKGTYKERRNRNFGDD